MAPRTVHLAAYDTLADWEFGHATPSYAKAASSARRTPPTTWSPSRPASTAR